MELNGKKIALICPKFYGYEDLIEHELKKRGATVYLIYENIEWVRIIYRLVYVYIPKYKKKLIENYYKKQLSGIAETIDLFMVVRGASLSPEILKWIKEISPISCKFVMYQWDGIKNNKTALDIAPFFDRISTFDKTDATSYGWIYRPLFFVSQYTDRNVKKDIDILFICALHSNRAKILNRLKLIAKENGYRLKSVVHLKKLLYYKYKYINKKSDVIEVDDKDLTFKPLTICESYKLYSRSKVVVDYTNINQTGYTMRTIEALGNNCKLITNNRLIVESDFYNNDNIIVYNEDEFDIPSDFIKSPYKIVSEDINDKYSLESWLDDLLGDII